MRWVAAGITLALCFGRGVGKSWFIRRLCYILISQWEYVERQTPDGSIRGVRIVFLLPTFKQFRDVHSRGLLTELRESFAFLGGKVDGTTFTVTFPGGSTIQVFPASEHGGQRARGIRCDVVVLDEADDIDGSVFDEVVTPWFTEPWSLKIKIASGTPKRGRHGLLFRLYDAGRKGNRVRAGDIEGLSPEEIEAYSKFYAVHATYRDAPGNVDQKTVEMARITMPPASFDREYNCNFDAGEGLVHPFVEAFHVAEPPPLSAFAEFLVGVDHGWQDAGVLLLAGVQGHGADATLWLLDEWYETEVPNQVWNGRAQAWDVIAGKKVTFYCDPSRPDRINDLRSLGLQIGQTDNEILGGIGRLAELMFIRESEGGDRWSRFYVSPRCVNTIREFGLYRRKRLGDGTFDEKPEDKNNHAMDAARYLAVGRFGRVTNSKTIAPGR